MDKKRLSLAASTALLMGLLMTVTMSAGAEPPHPGWKSTHSNAIATASESLTLERPAGLTSGDFMLAQVVMLNDPAIAVAPPDGWSEVRSDSSSRLRSTIYAKAAGDVEPAAYAWTFDRPVATSGGIVAYAGIDPLEPIIAANGASAEFGAPTAPSIDVPGEGLALLTAFFAVNKGPPLAAPAGMADQYLLHALSSDGDEHSTLAAGEAWTVAGATGARSLNAGEDTPWVAQHIALRSQPAADAGGGQQTGFQMWFAMAGRGAAMTNATPTSTPTRTTTPTSTPTRTTTPTTPPASGSQVLLLIDEDSLDNGIHFNAGGGPITPSGPNFFTEQEVNDDIAGIGQRAVLRYFAANVGRTITLMTGQTGDEGWFAPTCIPQKWLGGSSNTCIDPNSPDFATAINRYWAGSVPQDPLDKTPHVMPLRALGLNRLVGRNVCAVVYDSDVSINYDHGDPSLGVNGNLKGETLGRVALRVNSTSTLNNFSSSTLPQVNITIMGVGGCGQWLLFNAPAPESSSVPNDRTAPGSTSGYRRIMQWPAYPMFFP